ncbi:NUDIX hydrolase [Undibacterium curvum]|uniref:NUDIX hydrolase n=1 Tax=Undibacterium curvum TaxID=2762294 RepID=A0ABR7A3H5_9BURK|nr:NUDIX hydrolase [Undibacterium curvum]MBC3931473.1 NUDIX hydrolase [Undibacterium curvum]
MKFCSECATPVVIQIPPDDNRERFVCPACHTVHYQNPKLVVGSIPVWEDNGKLQVLLCKRAIEPRYGYWTLPAGFMENGETSSAAAERETQEEAGANIRLHDLFSILNVPHVHQVHLFYRASLLDLDFQPGTESLEVQLFSEADIPWQDIAFPTVSETLKFFFNNQRQVAQGGSYQLHEHDIFKPMRSDL